MKTCPLCGSEIEPQLLGDEESGMWFCTNEDCGFKYDPWDE